MNLCELSIVFIGSQVIGYRCLRQIIKMGVDIKAVFTFKPDEHEKWERSVEEIANERNIPVFFPEELTESKIQELNPELIIVVGYRKIFPQEILGIPELGVVGIHASLLPHLRGQAPLNWSIILNDKKTGATLFKMDKGIDTGNIIAQKEIPIKIEDTIVDIKEKISEISVEMISENLEKVLQRKCKMKVQPKNGTYGSARIPQDGKINWNDKSLKIYNLIRASEITYPAYTIFESKKLYILEAELLEKNYIYYGTPGQVGITMKDGSVVIITGDGGIKIKSVCYEDKIKKNGKVILKSSKIRLE